MKILIKKEITLTALPGTVAEVTPRQYAAIKEYCSVIKNSELEEAGSVAKTENAPKKKRNYKKKTEDSGEINGDS